MIKKIKIFVLISLLLLTDFYVIHPSVRIPTLAMAAFVLLLFFVRGLPVRVSRRELSMVRLVMLGLAFVVYMAALDLIRGGQPYEVTVVAFSHLMVLAMLPCFYDGGRQFNLPRWYIRIALISFCFALIQVGGLHIAMGDLIPNIGVVGSDRILEELIDRYGRATGATSNTVAFSIHMVILALLAYWAYLSQRKASIAFIGILAVLGLLFSQTRAALLAAVVGIVVAHIAFGERRFAAMARAVGMGALAVFGYWLLNSVAAEYFPYVFKEIDTGDTHRLWANWYMSIGVLKESPWFGISPDQAWDVYFRHGDLAVAYYYEEKDTPTHHNQIGYVLRYYGVIGLVFLLAMYTYIFRIVLSSESLFIRYFLSSYLIADFVYSMMHNNKLMGSPLTWALLALAFLPREQVERFFVFRARK